MEELHQKRTGAHREPLAVPPKGNVRRESGTCQETFIHLDGLGFQSEISQDVRAALTKLCSRKQSLFIFFANALALKEN
uniref:Uncharacterized protein n=1 Tax=Steinernema glaseri TaxID=37863 RepID=A0A1I7YSP6_9BILA